MHIAILGDPKSWHVEALARAGSNMAVSLDIVPFRRLAAGLGDKTNTLESGSLDLMTVDRVLVRGIPAGSLEQVVFRMNALHRLEAAGIPIINPPRAIETCVDKYLATARLKTAGLPVPDTVVCETPEQAIQSFFALGGDVVVKPLFGSEGQGIVRVSDPDVALRVFRSLGSVQAVLYLQRYVRHPGYDVRAFVVGDDVLAAMRRISTGGFRTNVSRGARFEPYEMAFEWRALAIRSARAVGALVAGVDLLPDENGSPLVVEVNSAPGFRALAQTTSIDIATAILQFVVASE